MKVYIEKDKWFTWSHMDVEPPHYWRSHPEFHAELEIDEETFKRWNDTYAAFDAMVREINDLAREQMTQTTETWGQ